MKCNQTFNEKSYTIIDNLITTLKIIESTRSVSVFAVYKMNHAIWEDLMQ